MNSSRLKKIYIIEEIVCFHAWYNKEKDETRGARVGGGKKWGKEKLAYRRRAQLDRATDWPGPPGVSRRRRWRLESPRPPLRLRHLHRPRHLRPMRSSPSPCQSPENEHQRFVKTVKIRLPRLPPPLHLDRRIGERTRSGEWRAKIRGKLRKNIYINI